MKFFIINYFYERQQSLLTFSKKYFVTKYDKVNTSFKNELSRIFLIAVGVFLFILFFQPFPLDMLNYDNRLLYVTGFGGITFLFTFLVLVLIPFLLPKWFKLTTWESGPPVILIFLLLLIHVTSFAFYIRFVGNTALSLYILFKILLVSLLPVIIINILYKNKSLERVIEVLRNQNKLYQLKISELENLEKDVEITLYSDNKAEKITMKYKDIISVHSADNYIEIRYLENDLVKKKLIRNTLKNIENQLAIHPVFIRCHRTSIVNTSNIQKLVRNYSGYALKMNGLKDNVRVSRQYLILIRDAISGLK